MKNSVSSILTLYAVSQIHAGSGAAVSTVDLPIQRERHTNYPCIYASSLKGAMRAHFREFIQEDAVNCEYKKNEDKQITKLINFIFGSDEQDDWKDKNESIPGAISVSDGKLLAFPMRSNIAPFVWVTCPNIINRLKRDLKFLKINDCNDINGLSIAKDDEAKIIIRKTDNGTQKEDKVILEDAVVNLGGNINLSFIETNFPEIHTVISETSCLLLISDEMFDYCISSCTEIQTNIKIDSRTGTAQDGTLRYQEFLPSDSILYAIVNFKNQQCEAGLLPEAVSGHVQKAIKDFIQIGGDETLGKGICKIDWVGDNKSKPNTEV